MLNPAPLRVALLCSSRAPGVHELLSDPMRGMLYELACVISTEPDFPEIHEILEAGIPCAARPRPPKNLSLRRHYDAETASQLMAFDVDVVVLCCYLRILTAPMLEAFPGRIINLHDSDLAVTTADGARRYVGLRSTRDAIAAGETHTRATAHWVNERVDCGPILLRTKPFPVSSIAADARAWGATDILKAYAYAHREWVIRTSWGPLMKRAIHLLAESEADLHRPSLAAVSA